MMEQGWQALAEGDLGEAETWFAQAMENNRQALDPYLGMAKVKLALGEAAEAESYAERAASMDRGVHSKLVLAQVFSYRGRRVEATKALREVLQREPQNSLALALMGEQRIRQGYWDDGTKMFIKAVTHDPTGDGQKYLQKVVSDMVDAVIVRKIRPAEALKFINVIDYSTPNDTPAMVQFFANARRSLNSGIPMDIDDATLLSAPGRGELPRERAPAPPEPHASSRLARNPTKPSQTSSVPSRAPKPPPSMSSQSSRPSLQPSLFTNTKGPAYLEAIREDRRLNEELQNQIAPTAKMSWPSDRVNPIDTIAPIGFSYEIGSIRKTSQLNDFHITDGSLISEIFLERCLNTLLRQVEGILAGTLVVHPNEFAQLELNLLDGLLERLPPVALADLGDDMGDNLAGEDEGMLALGKFLGDSLVNAYYGVWQYKRIPTDSFIYVGSQKFAPFEIARAWMNAQDKDAVTLQEIARRAKASIPSFRFVADVFEHIDLTTDLKGDALAIRLAEIWSVYRFELARVTPSEMVNGIRVLWSNDQVVIFRIAESWMPNLPSSWVHRGKYKNGYSMAHLRETGEFFPMCSSKGFALTLESICQDLEQSSVQQIFDLLRDHFAPTHKLIGTDEDADLFGKRLQNSAIESPRLRSYPSGRRALIFWLATKRDAQAWELSLTHEAPIKWTLRPQS